MQAIILAAGMGRRLGALTAGNTKCMLSVNGKRLIDRDLEALSSYGLKKVVIVVGYQGQNLIDYIGDRYKDVFDIEYVWNRIYDKTNNIYSLALAKDLLCEDDTILMESDLIYDKALLDSLVESADPDLALVSKYESWMDGTMVRIDDERNIINFIPKAAFRYEDSGLYYKTVNIYKFSKEFSRDKYVPFLEAYCKVMGNNEYYEQVLGVLVFMHGSSLKALEVGGRKWYEIDDVQDLDIASTLFSDGEVKYHEYHKRYGGFWRFPGLMDYCYLVNPYFPTARMKEEIKANADALIGNYPSGMYVNSLLAGKYFGISQDFTVVGNGAAELIRSVMQECVTSKVGIAFPTFDEYPNRLPDSSIVPFMSSRDDFSYTAEELIAFYSANKADVIVLVNPDNPSGQFMPVSDVLKLAAWCEQEGIKLLVDESFADFADRHCGDEVYGTTLLRDDILEAYPYMMVVKSISKSYGVPGLRLGILASGDKTLISHLKKEVSIWNINSFAEFYMQIFGKYESDYMKACDKFRQERSIFFGELQEIPYLRVIPSQANYFLCEVTSRFTASSLTRKLIEHNVIISDCSLKRNMSGRQFIRLAIRDRADNSRLAAILRAL